MEAAMSATIDADLALDAAPPGTFGPPSLVVGLLWFLAIALMFFAQHHVCDAYFIPAINVFTEKMRKSESKSLQRWGEEAVAGATICALGCNGPELFCNLIALYTHSDAGIGVVVGSEIFNLLIIIGAATLSAPMLPLSLEVVPFTRDCLAYLLSIVLLYVFLMDKQITATEAYILLGAAVGYVLVVYFTSDIARMLGQGPKEQTSDVAKSASEKSVETQIHGIDVEVQQIVHGRMADKGSKGEQMNMDTDSSAGLMTTTEEEIREAQQEKAKSSKKNKRASVGINMGGASDENLLGAKPMLMYKDLTEVCILAEGVMDLEFQKGMGRLTLRVKTKGSDERDKLLGLIKEHEDKMWVHKYNPTIVGAIENLKHECGHGNIFAKILSVPEFFIDAMLRLTLFMVDVKDVKKEGRWPLCFCGAMCWLAVFSFLMLEIANIISYNIPALTPAFLGITVCAVGTSFPNAVASIIMSSQNKPAAAIANALGSNVQNVFLAMALPWVIYSSVTLHFGPIPQSVKGINEGVFWMLVTLILLVVMVLPMRCKLNKIYGFILCIVYVAWLVLTSMEAFGYPSPIKPLIG